MPRPADDEPSGLTKFYLKVRGSYIFLTGFCVFIATWLAGHFLLGFDKELGGINLVLSVEASVMSSILLAVMQRQDELVRHLLKSMLHMLEAVKEMLGDE